MKGLAIYDWGQGLEIASIYSALREHFGEPLLDDKQFMAIVNGWPRATKVSIDELKKLLSHPERIQSIDGELTFDLEKITASISIAINSTPKMLFIGVPSDVEEIARFGSFCEILAQKDELGYGFVFQANDRTEATFYAAGVTYARAGTPIKEVVSDADDRWFNERVLGKDGRRRYIDDGMLRGVYELNVLNASHLERRIGGEKLFDTVGKKGWGSIKRITACNWLWRIDGQNRIEAEEYLRSGSSLI